MNNLPQGMMHRMRAGFADGSPVRNRSMEQFSTRSGNPNMPMFNTSRPPMDATKPAASFHPPMRVTGGGPYNTASMQPAGYLQNLINSANTNQMGTPAMAPRFTGRQGVLPRFMSGR